MVGIDDNPMKLKNRYYKLIQIDTNLINLCIVYSMEYHIYYDSVAADFEKQQNQKQQQNQQQDKPKFRLIHHHTNEKLAQQRFLQVSKISKVSTYQLDCSRCISQFLSFYNYEMKI